jgi:hypothetical protein
MNINIKKFSALFLIGLLVFGFSSCKDDEDPPVTDDTPKTKTELLTTGSWLMESGTIAPSIVVDIFGTKVTIATYWELLAALNGSATAEPCLKDNLMVFKLDSTVTLDEGPLKCDPSDPQTEDGGNWLFSENDTKLTFTAFPYDPLKEPRTLDILKLTSTDMDLEMEYEFVDPVTTDTTDHIILLHFKNR